MFDNSILRKYYRMHSSYINSCIEYAHYTGGVITGLHEDKERILEVMHLDTLQQQVFPVFYNKTKDFERSISKTYSTVALYRYGAAGITDKLSLVDDLVPEIMDFMPDITQLRSIRDGLLTVEATDFNLLIDFHKCNDIPNFKGMHYSIATIVFDKELRMQVFPCYMAENSEKFLRFINNCRPDDEFAYYTKIALFSLLSLY